MHILRSVVVITALASGTISFFAPPVQAAVLTIGQAGHQAKGPYGRFVCAEVSAGSLSPGTPIQAWSCHGGPNQQFEFNSLAIYALGGQGVKGGPNSGHFAATECGLRAPIVPKAERF
jgi:hypothetical protein